MKSHNGHEHELSKNQRRKARRYGKKPTDMSSLSNRQQCGTNPEFVQFIRSLVQPRSEEDHSLDELEYEKRHYPLLPGSFETGKRR